MGPADGAAVSDVIGSPVAFKGTYLPPHTRWESMGKGSLRYTLLVGPPQAA